VRQSDDHSNPFRLLHRVPATGRVVRFGAINILRIDQGKLVEGWGGQDMLGLMRQFGADSIPGQAGR
jgi:predicted ester cyclase